VKEGRKGGDERPGVACSTLSSNHPAPIAGRELAASRGSERDLRDPSLDAVNSLQGGRERGEKNERLSRISGEVGKRETKSPRQRGVHQASSRTRVYPDFRRLILAEIVQSPCSSQRAEELKRWKSSRE